MHSNQLSGPGSSSFSRNLTFPRTRLPPFLLESPSRFSSHPVSTEARPTPLPMLIRAESSPDGVRSQSSDVRKCNGTTSSTDFAIPSSSSPSPAECTRSGAGRSLRDVVHHGKILEVACASIVSGSQGGIGRSSRRSPSLPSADRKIDFAAGPTASARRAIPNREATTAPRANAPSHPSKAPRLSSYELRRTKPLASRPSGRGPSSRGAPTGPDRGVFSADHDQASDGRAERTREIASKGARRGRRAGGRRRARGGKGERGSLLGGEGACPRGRSRRERCRRRRSTVGTTCRASWGLARLTRRPREPVRKALQVEVRLPVSTSPPTSPPQDPKIVRDLKRPRAPYLVSRQETSEENQAN